MMLRNEESELVSPGVSRPVRAFEIKRNADGFPIVVREEPPGQIIEQRLANQAETIALEAYEAGVLRSTCEGTICEINTAILRQWSTDALADADAWPTMTQEQRQRALQQTLARASILFHTVADLVIVTRATIPATERKPESRDIPLVYRDTPEERGVLSRLAFWRR